MRRDTGEVPNGPHEEQGQVSPRLEDPLEERLEFLLQLGCGLLESGQKAASTRYLVATCGRGLGLQGMKAMTRGRMLRVGAQGPDGTPGSCPPRPTPSTSSTARGRGTWPASSRRSTAPTPSP
ncbi:hypothetical protein [Actinomyces provencensis]|uniref:hypothetical protein n=1 Tax=Actinomyces provencensis TaxID=1720198 RepID=UPI0018A8787F|nr:hypothetical protein [Actinomyces provencensis]